MRLGPPRDRISRPFWLLVLVLGSGTLGMHVFVPALPLVAAEFGSDTAATQYAISLYMFALAFGQIVYGPLSDRIGRRPALIGGLVLYAAAGLLASQASSLFFLLVARVLQGFGGCAGLVLGRAIVQDTERDANAASTVAKLNTAMLISPALAPIAGVWLAEAYGWRSVPLMLGLIGLIALAGTVLLLSETGSTGPQRPKLAKGDYGRLLGSPTFLVNMIGGSLTTATLFTLLATSPFVVVEQLGRPLGEVGYYYLVFVGGIMAGSLVAGRFAGRIGFEALILTACAIGAVAGIALLVLSLLDQLSPPAYLLCGFLFTLMAGIMGPLALTKSIGVTETLRGSAAGIYGCVQMAIGAVSIVVAGAGADVTISSSAVLAFCGTAGFLIFAVSRIVRRHPR